MLAIPDSTAFVLLSCSRPGPYALSGCLRRSGCSADSYGCSCGSYGVSGGINTVSVGGFSDGVFGPPDEIVLVGAIGFSIGITLEYCWLFISNPSYLGIEIQEYNAYKRKAKTTAIVILVFISDVTVGFFYKIKPSEIGLASSPWNQRSKLTAICIII